MEYEDISQNINDGVYEPAFKVIPLPLKKGTVTDREMSVAWNELMVEKSADDYRAAIQEQWEVTATLRQRFEGDLASFVLDDVGFDMTPEQAAVVVEEAWAEGHSGGYGEVLCEAHQLCEFLDKFVKAKK